MINGEIWSKELNCTCKVHNWSISAEPITPHAYYQPKTHHPSHVPVLLDSDRIGHAAQLHNDGIKVTAVHEGFNAGQKLIRETAAGTSILQFDGPAKVGLNGRAGIHPIGAAGRLAVVAGIGNQLGIDVDRGDVVDDDADLDALAVLEEIFQGGGLARTEESGQQSDGDSIFGIGFFGGFSGREKTRGSAQTKQGARRRGGIGSSTGDEGRGSRGR